MASPFAWLEELGALLYPGACRLCGEPVDDPAGLACALHRLPRRPRGPRCGRCLAALAESLPDGRTCAACVRSPPGLRRVVALADYREDAEVREWLLAFKHGGRRDLGLSLGASLAAAWRRSPGGPDPEAVLCPVPLHPWRRFERGYDQAACLADGISAATGLPVMRLLERRRVTPPQGAFGSPARGANVAGAFRAVPIRVWRARARPIWLVDDVTTSGATADSAARSLRSAGLSPVGLAVVAVARGGAARQDVRP